MIENWAALVIGVMGGFVYIGLKVDDPVDAIPIHGGCGILGAQFPGLFHTEKGLLYGYGGYQWGV